MAIHYKLVKVEDNKPLQYTVLSEGEYYSLLDSLTVYNNHLTDSEPYESDGDDFAEWEANYFHFESLDRKIGVLNGVM
jgi:2-keto-3-deoxy-galactonokinase